MSQLIKHKPRLLTIALLLNLAASLLFAGTALAVVSPPICYIHSTSTVTDCASVQQEDPTFKTVAGACYDIQEHPSGVSITPVGCAAQAKLSAKPAPLQNTITTPGGGVNLGDATGKYTCGGGNDTPINTSINFGCVGKGNATLDLIFAIIRFLSAGAGIIIIASMVFAGIQYTVSRGDPSASAAAMKRIQNTLIALLIYIFAYAILNYIIPAGLLN